MELCYCGCKFSDHTGPGLHCVTYRGPHECLCKGYRTSDEAIKEGLSVEIKGSLSFGDFLQSRFGKAPTKDHPIEECTPDCFDASQAFTVKSKRRTE